VTAAGTFGVLVRRRRKALDLTQAALADLVGCAESLIRKIEAEERRPSRQIAERLAAALEVAAEERARFVQLARGEWAAVGLAPAVAPVGAASVPTAPLQALPPPPPGELFGRTTELLALDALLADPATRLLTIVAPGGTGKTRLAIAAGERQQGSPRFPDGVCFIDLTPVEQAGHVAVLIGAALGLTAHSGGGQAGAEAQLLAQLSRRRLLLILDNGEHLLDAAPLFAAIVRHAPGVVLLVTSRLRLQLQAEQLFPLGGLSAPDEPALAARSPASSLFLQVARRNRPGWEPTDADRAAIAAICRLTGGMPLALELAGAWASVLAPAEILNELRHSLDLLVTDLRDVPERQRSMGAVLDATWRQLSIGLQRVFARLAVFHGGFSRAAATEVAGATLRDLADLSAAALLSSTSGGERYTIHVLLQQYAAERLAEDAAAAAEARDGHIAFYCAYLAQYAPELRGDGQHAAQAALELEQENIEAAWRQIVRLRRAEWLMRLAQPMTLFYLLRADILRGAAAFDHEVAALANDNGLPAELRARLMISCSAFRRPLGQVREAEELARRALVLVGALRQAGGSSLTLEAYGRLQLALALDDLGQPDSIGEYTLALQAFRALGRHWDASYLLYLLGRHACEVDQHAAAFDYAQESLALRQRLGDSRGIAHSLQLMSQVHCATGQLSSALMLAQQSHDRFAQLIDLAGVAKAMRQIGAVLFWQGRFTEAMAALCSSAAAYEELGLIHELGTVQAQLSRVYSALGLGSQALAAALVAIEQSSLLPAPQIAAHLAYGIALLASGTPVQAEEQLRHASRLHQQSGHTTPAAAAPYLALCLLKRDSPDEARQLLRQALDHAVTRRALSLFLPSLATAATLVAERGEAAAEVARRALRLPWIAGHHGMWHSLPARQTPDHGLDPVDIPPEVWQMASSLEEADLRDA
jgi:predicted ATPase/transcriptional regulator with XRE-family HTH domain